MLNIQEIKDNQTIVQNKYNTLILSFSLRKDSQSAKIARHLSSELSNKDCKNKVIDMFEIQLPLWSEHVWKGQYPAQFTLIKERLELATSLILITPEYNGAASPSLHNFLLYLKGHNFTPTLIVSVSSGRSGSYPISELRSYGNKNTKVNIIPEHIIVRDCNNVLNEIVDTNSKEDIFLRDRISYTLDVLNIYQKAFVNIKEEIKNLNPSPAFTNGM